MDSKTFRRRLREDGDYRAAFGGFVRELRRGKWETQREIREDAGIKQMCEETGLASAATFVRLLDRVIETGEVSRQNLYRLAVAFGGSEDELIKRFDGAYARLAPVAEDAVVSGGFAKHPTEACYWLAHGTPLVSRKGMVYTIGDRLKPTNPGSASYSATDREGQPVFIKTLSIEIGMRAEEISPRIAQLTAFLDGEQKMLERLKEVENVARFLDHGEAPLEMASGFAAPVPFLAQQWIDGDTLDVAIPKRYAGVGGGGDGAFRGIQDVQAWTTLVRGLMLILQDVHAQGIWHRDIQANNVMIRTSDGLPQLVDFGQSAMHMPTQPAQGTGLGETELGQPRAAGRQTQNIPIEPTTDVYGLGKIMLWLATGQTLGTPPIADNHELRERIRRLIDQHNPTLAQANPGIIYAISLAMHYKHSEHAAEIEDLLHTLDAFARMGTPARRGLWTPASEMRDEAAKLGTAVEALQDKEGRTLFSRVIGREISQLLRRTREMLAHDRLEISGTRERIIAAMLDFLGLLEPGDLYVTTSAPNFWSRVNLGIQGRFWEANRVLALRRVRIRRLIVVHRTDLTELKEDEFVKIFQSQAKLATELPAAVSSRDASVAGPGYFTGVYEAKSAEDRDAILADGEHIALVQKTDASAVSLSFHVDELKTVRRLSIWKLPPGSFIVDRLSEVGKRLAFSTSVDQWVSEQMNDWIDKQNEDGQDEEMNDIAKARTPTVKRGKASSNLTTGRRAPRLK